MCAWDSAQYVIFECGGNFNKKKTLDDIYVLSKEQYYNRVSAETDPRRLEMELNNFM